MRNDGAIIKDKEGIILKINQRAFLIFPLNPVSFPKKKVGSAQQEKPLHLKDFKIV